MKAVDFRRQLEQRFELRTRLCELEQRLVELELEHLGSPYFIVKRERLQGCKVLRHGKSPEYPEPRRQVRMLKPVTSRNNETCTELGQPVRQCC